MATEGEVIACHTPDVWKEKFESANAANKLIVIDFTASWCPPCRFIAPVFADLAKKTPHVAFFKVDVDELQAVAQEFNIEAMPTFVFLKDGKEVGRVVGADKAELEQTLIKHAVATAAA